MATKYVFTGGSIDWRFEVRSDKLYLDKELTVEGFDGEEDEDWKPVERYQ